MGAKAVKSTPADKRLKSNKVAKPMAAAKAAPKTTTKIKFGSPAWDAKYGVKPKGK